MMDEVQVNVSDFSYVQALSRNYILQCCLYWVSQSFHNLLQYTKNVLRVFERYQHIQRNEEVFSLCSNVIIHRTNFEMKHTLFPNLQSQRSTNLTLHKIDKLTNCESLVALTNNTSFTLVQGCPECLVLLKDIHPTIKQFKHPKTGTSLITASPNALCINC